MDTEQAKREEQAMRALTARLIRRFSDSRPADEVTQTIDVVHHDFDGRPIRDFVPVLVERIASEKLRAATPA